MGRMLVGRSRRLQARAATAGKPRHGAHGWPGGPPRCWSGRGGEPARACGQRPGRGRDGDALPAEGGGGLLRVVVRVRLRCGGMDGAGGAHEARPRAPGAAVDGALAVLDEARRLTDAASRSPARRRRTRQVDGVAKALVRAWAGRRTASVRVQGLGAARGRGRTAFGVRSGARRGLEDGGRVRARRPAGEAAVGDAGVVRVRVRSRMPSRCRHGLTD